MNFLSHFMLDGRRNAPYYNLGLILPDLMGMYERGWGLDLPAKETLPEKYQQLTEGFFRHEEVDKVFHNSLFFKQNTRTLSGIMKDEGFINPPFRLFYLSHILLELLMDRLFVQQYSNLTNQFYLEIANVEKDVLLGFLKTCTTQPQPEFWDFFRVFVEKRFVLSYAQDHHLLTVVNKISERVNHPKIEKDLEASFFRVVKRGEDHLRKRYKAFFYEIAA